MCGCTNLNWWLKNNKENILNEVATICKINPKELSLLANEHDGSVYIEYRPNQYTVLLAEFNMLDFATTESIAIVSRVYVEEKFRGLGLGQYLHKLRIAFAKEEKIDFLMVITIQTNDVQNHIMKKNGWKIIKSYTTSQYKQKVYLWMLDINKNAPSEH